MFKAVFIDVDGTLIRSDHTVAATTVETIQKLKEKNILVVLVSARPLHGMLRIIAETGLKDSPVASLNGAFIVWNDEILFSSFIEYGIAERLRGHIDIITSTPIYYQQNIWYAEASNNFTDKEQKITAVPLVIQPFTHISNYWKATNNGANKILVISEEGLINNLQVNLRSAFSEQLNIATSKPTYLELMNKNASKLKAVQFLIKRYSINQEQVIAIGDNFNDEEMIRFAGMGVAMGNAPGEVKSAADYVTDTNNDDGVSKALIKIMDL